MKMKENKFILCGLYDKNHNPHEKEQLYNVRTENPTKDFLGILYFVQYSFTASSVSLLIAMEVPLFGCFPALCCSVSLFCAMCMLVDLYSITGQI